jgi:hypothetical protein
MRRGSGAAAPRRIAIALVTLALAIASATGLGACGDEGPQTEQEQVAAVVRDFNKAFGSGDGDRTCELITDIYRQAIEQGNRKPCPEVVQAMTKQGAPEARDIATLRDAEVSNVQLVGDVATADVTGAGVPDGPPAQCQKQNGKWLVSATAVGGL